MDIMAFLAKEAARILRTTSDESEAAQSKNTNVQSPWRYGRRKQDNGANFAANGRISRPKSDLAAESRAGTRPEEEGESKETT